MNYAEFKDKYQIELNKQQEVAVQAVEGPVLLLAVPGSGKTTVLINRLGYMIVAKGIRPESILTVTYTVAATNDMRKRFQDRFGEEYAAQMEFRTINGISQKILQYFGRLTGKEPFAVADKETASIVKKVYLEVTGQYPTEMDIKNVQTAITYVKNMRLSQEEIDSLAVDVEHFSLIYSRYNKELRGMSMIDYDDQMVYALRILEQFPEVLSFFQGKYQYICVDEAQDTSKIQHDMIDLLAAKSGNLFMVGDEDQSIYGFRAAYPEALVNFEKNHPGAKVLLMESNYRSNEEIVRVADKLIQYNKNRHKKTMKATREPGTQVTEIKAQSRKGQYNYLVKVAENCDRETAVLYRNNESALPLIDMLERKGISYRVKNSDMTFFSHPVVNDICDYIRLALNPYDEEAFLRIYYKMGAGISKVVATSVVENNRRTKSLIDAVAEHREVSSYTKKQCRSLSTHFRNMCTESAGKAIYRIIHYMGYQEYMNTHGMDEGKAEILYILGQQEERLVDFPERLAYLNEITTNCSGSYNSNFILSTIHSSKGLEYERVYMVDMIAGILPSGTEPVGKNPNPVDVQAYEEERRLYYVGMTRAKDELYIFTFGAANTSKFSRTVLGLGRSEPVRKKVSGYSQTKYTPYKGNSKASTSAYDKPASEFKAGAIVLHKKYGRGVVVHREKDIAEILFDGENKAKKISLSMTVENDLLHIVK